MRVNTKAYGIIELDERQKITFPNGLFGFESYKDFILLDADQPPFYWLQSLDVQKIAFVLIKPEIFRPDYDSGLTIKDLIEIGVESMNPESLLIFSIVTVTESMEDMTANLQGPIYINIDNKIGKQYIASKYGWLIKHNILEELSSQGEE